MSTHRFEGVRSQRIGQRLNKRTGLITVLDPTLVTSGGGSDTKPDRTRVRKASGWLFPKSYSRQILKHGTVTGLVIIDSADYVTRYEGNMTGQVSCNSPTSYRPGSTELNNSRNKAITNALLKLKAQKVNLGVAFAERKQTANLLAGTAERLARAAQFARKGKWSRAADSLGVSSRKQQPSNWLELQYGWKPLLGDVYGATEALAQTSRYDWLITVKAGTFNDIDEYDDFLSGSTYAHVKHVTGQWGHFIRCDYHPGNAFMKVVSYTGISNPAEIQWELIGGSFIVDWMYGVGDYLATLDAAAGYEFLSGSITQRERLMMQIRSGKVPGNVSSKYSGKSSFFNLNREVLRSSPLPLGPVYKDPISAGHVANALSLLASAFGRR